MGDIDMVANCHLHFDHCGGNARLGGIPVFVQTVELEDARKTPDYTLPGLIGDNRFETISGADARARWRVLEGDGVATPF